jgi:hypothetical protein
MTESVRKPSAKQIKLKRPPARRKFSRAELLVRDTGMKFRGEAPIWGIIRAQEEAAKSRRAGSE